MADGADVGRWTVGELELRDFRDGIFADHRGFASWLDIPAVTALKCGQSDVRAAKLHISNTTTSSLS